MPTAQKKMAANAHASILYRKIYKMPCPNLPPYSFFAPAPAPERSLGLDRKGKKKKKSFVIEKNLLLQKILKYGDKHSSTCRKTRKYY
jgi:hypothetical protein